MHASARHKPAPSQPVRTRARRERRSAAARQPVLHVMLPGLEVAQAVPRSRETITAFLRRTGWATRDREYGWQFRKGLPTILLVNGEAVLRKHWRSTRFGAGDVVRFVSKPLGGGKGGFKQVVGLVALVALAAFAAPLAGGILGSMGIAAATPIGIGTLTAGQLLTGGLLLGGSLLISALTAPKTGATNAPNATVDQIYSAQAAGNAAKLGQPLPVWYGRQKTFPDFAASPWGEFVGNDQYLNLLLSTSVGRMSYEQMLVDDTPFWNPTDGVLPAFSSAQVAFYEPGETVTLFPVNVSQAAEVSGQELPNGSGSIDGGSAVPGAWLGGFVANPSGTLAQAIAIDFVFPAGCFTTNKNNGNTAYTKIGITAEYRAVDAAGAALEDFRELFSQQRVYGSRSPIRDSVQVGVAPGRYEVRFRRDDGEVAENDGASKIIWAGLRAFVAGNNSFPVSTIAIRIKASESTQGSFRFGVIGTRILPAWDADSATFIEQPTRSPIWAGFDIATNTSYGAEHPVSRVEFNAVVNEAAAAHARGDTFDYIFTSAEAVPDAIDKALTVTRTKHFWLGDTLSVVRDEWRDVPTMMLTDREIVRDSVQVSVNMLGEEDPDAVVIEYVDENTWRPAQVQYPPEVAGPGGFHALNAEPKRIDGIVNRQQAFREAAFYYLQSIYRREQVGIKCEYEGRAITFGSVIRVQSELPQDYGQSGAIVSRDIRELTLDPAPTWAVGEQHYIRLRRPNGKSFGPIKVTKGGADNLAMLDAADLASVETQQGITLAAVLARADGAEDPSFELGTADNQSRLAMVLGGQPNGDLCTLSLVVDDERVHATDLGEPPILPAPQYPTDPSAPLIAGLNAMFTQGVAEPMLLASWFPAPGAFFYRAEVSYDNGASWLQVYEGVANQLSAVATLAALTLRVQAIGMLSGPYSTVDLAAPTIEILANTVAYNSLKDAVKEQVTTIVDGRFADRDRRLAEMATAVQEVLGRTNIDKKEVRSQQISLYGQNKAAIETVAITAADASAAVADLSTAVAIQFDDLTASVTENSSAIGALDGYAAAKWSVAVDVNGNAVGLVLFNDSDNVSNFTVTADTFQVAFPGHAGGAAVPVYTIANVGGVAKLALRGDMIVDGSIITQMISAGAITSVKIQAGAINTAQLAINSVDINTVIAGAMSNEQFFSHGAKAQGSGTNVIVSAIFNVQKSGNVTVHWSADLSMFVTTVKGLTILSRPVELIVDGSVYKTWNIGLYESVSGTATQSDYYGLNSSPLTAYVTGLSAGNHTFAINLPTPVPFEISAGYLKLTNLRN